MRLASTPPNTGSHQASDQQAPETTSCVQCSPARATLSTLAPLGLLSACGGLARRRDGKYTRRSTSSCRTQPAPIRAADGATGARASGRGRDADSRYRARSCQCLQRASHGARARSCDRAANPRVMAPRLPRNVVTSTQGSIRHVWCSQAVCWNADHRSRDIFVRPRSRN